MKSAAEWAEQMAVAFENVMKGISEPLSTTQWHQLFVRSIKSDVQVIQADARAGMVSADYWEALDGEYERGWRDGHNAAVEAWATAMLGRMSIIETIRALQPPGKAKP